MAGLVMGLLLKGWGRQRLAELQPALVDALDAERGAAGRLPPPGPVSQGGLSEHSHMDVHVTAGGHSAVVSITLDGSRGSSSVRPLLEALTGLLMGRPGSGIPSSPSPRRVGGAGSRRRADTPEPDGATPLLMKPHGHGSPRWL